MNKKILILCLGLAAALQLNAQKAMNRPYIDDKLFHFGFSLGVNFMDYSFQTLEDSQNGMMALQPNGFDSIQGAAIDARCSYMIPGFSVGFIGDVRLCKSLNLRLIPQLHFAERDITYYYEKPDGQGGTEAVKHKTSLLCIPISVPLELKWSADRCGNYRPYCTVGGGVSYNCFENREKPIIPKRLDYFLELGAGCDFYFSWFKLCPQLKYTLGFNDISPVHEGKEYLNSSVVQRMRNHMISLVFNFE